MVSAPKSPASILHGLPLLSSCRLGVTTNYRKLIDGDAGLVNLQHSCLYTVYHFGRRSVVRYHENTLTTISRTL